MSPLGLIIAGPVADRLGVQTWFIIGGVVCGLMGLAGYFIPAVMTFEDGRKQYLPVSPVELTTAARPAEGD
jgi:MFS family permease